MIIPYTCFTNAIVRTPAFPLNADYDEITSSPAFEDAIYIASPELFKLWKEGRINEQKKHTLLKYAIRAKNRCTPFGLFSACATIPIVAEETKIQFDRIRDHSELNLDCCALGGLLNSIDIKTLDDKKTMLYLNGSSYIIDRELRFIGYKIDKKLHLSYSLSSYELDEALSQVLVLLRKGTTVSQLLEILTESVASKEEAIEYIKELLFDRMIIPKTDLSVITPSINFPILQSIQCNVEKSLEDSINKFARQFNNSNTENRRTIANDIVCILKDRIPHIHDNQVIQVDMLREMTESSGLLRAVVDDCISLIPSLMYYSSTLRQRNPQRLSIFKEKFLKRFDRQAVSLMYALDPDVGIGYDEQSYGWDESDLLKGISFRFRKDRSSDKLQSFLHTKEYRSEINLPQVKDYATIHWSDLPDTMAIFCSLFKDSDGKTIIYLKNIGGCSALNTIARFAHLSKNILRLVNEIADFEQEHNQDDAKMASIDILPNLRAGNVLRHPDFRKSRISFTNIGDNALPLNQLNVAVENDRIVLIDRNDGKHVIPCIDSALLFENTHLTVYKFLCDLQSQGLYNAVFNNTFFTGSTKYIPRIVISNFIIRRAEWHIDYIESFSSEESLYEYSCNTGIPKNCVIVELDNELRLDLEKEDELSIAFNILLKRKKLVLCEDLLSIYPDMIIRDKQGNSYSNEFVIPIHKIYG